MIQLEPNPQVSQAVVSDDGSKPSCMQGRKHWMSGSLWAQTQRPSRHAAQSCSCCMMPSIAFATSVMSTDGGAKVKSHPANASNLEANALKQPLVKKLLDASHQPASSINARQHPEASELQARLVFLLPSAQT
jgi:hypothetical protein